MQAPSGYAWLEWAITTAVRDTASRTASYVRRRFDQRAAISMVSANPPRSNTGISLYDTACRDANQRSTITAMAYSAGWNSTDQIPQRAVEQGLVGRFGANRVAGVGMLLLAGGLVLFSLTGTDTAYLQVLVTFVVLATDNPDIPRP